jgi:hypothetical protein
MADGSDINIIDGARTELEQKRFVSNQYDQPLSNHYEFFEKLESER